MGPLVCGVIGATKPVFDIWGDTVNEASRMDSTGTLGCIQVSQQTATVSQFFHFCEKIISLCFFIFQLLAERGYIVKERGVINVKGKGEMLTFYVMGRKISRSWRFGRTVNQGNNSLAEVVYGMVRARKRRTARKGKGSKSSYRSSNPHFSFSSCSLSFSTSCHYDVRFSHRTKV